MKRNITLSIFALLLLLVAWQGYERILRPMVVTPPAPPQIEKPTVQENTVVGKIWDQPPKNKGFGELQEPPRLPDIPRPTQITQKQAQLPSNEEEINEEWPLTKQMEKTMIQTSVEVGNTIKEIPKDAEKIIPATNPDLEEENRKTSLPTLDPRQAEALLTKEQSKKRWEELSEEERMEQEYEPTNIEVQRTFIATLPDGEKKTIRVRVPVVYKSRNLRMDEEQIKKARDIITRAKALEETLANAKKEAEGILRDWNDVVRASTPRNALLPESPSLPENQSSGELNRPDTDPSLTPGAKAVIQVSQP